MVAQVNISLNMYYGYKFKVYTIKISINQQTMVPTLVLPALPVPRLLNNNPSNELTLSIIISQLLKCLLSSERILIKLNINLPFGGSRFVIARK